MALTPILPKPSAPIVTAGGLTTSEWFEFFRLLRTFAGDNSDAQGQITALEERVTALEEADDDEPRLVGPLSVRITGSLADSLVQFYLLGDVDAPGNTYHYGTGPDGVKGFFAVADAFTEGDGITLTVGTDGVTEIALADLADTGVGAFQLLTRDAQGRLEGTVAGTAADVPYDNTASGLAATEIQAAIDELAAGGGGSGTVTSVNLASTTGLTASGGPITTAGSLTYTLHVTLQALAAGNWSLNSLAIGSGSNTVAQVTFAANTFPARASTGDLVAKPITDQALTLLGTTTTDSLPEGASNLYHTAARVLATLLAGLSTASTAAVTAADSILVAIGKLQAQSTAQGLDIGDKEPAIGAGTAAQFWNGLKAWTNELLGAFLVTIDGAGIGQTLTKYSANTAAFQLRFQKARGSFASPASVQSGDALLSFQGRGGYSTAGVWTAFSDNVGTVELVATEAFTSTAQGTAWTWSTVAATTTTRADRLYLDSTTLRPVTDNALDLGSAALRYANGYVVNLRPGAGAVIWTSGSGTPEAAVTAPIGSLFTRTDGSTGTTLYVKESGAGNTGWVAVAAGGGSLTNWTEAVSTAAPNATIPAVSFTATNAATNVDAVLAAKGTGATLAQVPNNLSSGGNKRGTQATDFQKSRSVNTQVASGTRSFLGAGTANTVSQTDAANVAGNTNDVSGQSAFNGCGQANTVSGTYGTNPGGNANTVSNQAAACGGGESNTSDGASSWLPGGQYGTTRAVGGAGAYASGRFAAQGDAQVQRYVLRCSTTNNTQTALTTNASAASTVNQVILPNASAYIVKAVVVARENATGDSKSWEVTAHIKRGANAAATAMVAAATVTVVAETGAGGTTAAWALAVDADTTNGALRFRFTGETSKTIRTVVDVYACAQVSG